MSDPDTIALLEALDAATRQLHEAASKLANTLEPVAFGLERKTLMDNVKLYAAIDYVSDVAKEIARVANVVEPVVAERVTKRMLAEDMDTLHFNGYSFSPDDKTYVSVSAENMPVVMRWMRGHETGKELIKEMVHPKTFESFIKELKDKGSKIPEEVKVFVKPTLAMRKLKGK